MIITYGTNAQGESIKITTLPSGTVVTELDRPSPIYEPPWTDAFIQQAYRARLLGHAATLKEQGNTFEAAKLLIKAGV